MNPSIVSPNRRLIGTDLYTGLGIIIGIVMPIVSACLFPTYVHEMHPAWIEWARLTELPFVLSEFAIIQAAIGRGYRDVAIWRALPRDIRIAAGLLLVGITVSSITASRNPPASITISIVTVIHLRFAAAVYFLAGTAAVEKLRELLPLIGVGLVVLTVLTAWRFLLPPPAAMVPGGVIEWASAMPGFINVRHLGSWAGAAAAGTMIALLYDREAKAGPQAAWYFLAAAITCWSGTRGAVAALVLVAIIVAASVRRLPAPHRLGWMLLASGAALAVSIALAPADPAFSLFRFGALDEPNTITSGRVELWRQTLWRWLDAPLFGWGSGSTFWEVDIGWAHTQPHNAILQFLISWGLVGAAGALWLIGRGVAAAHRQGMSDERLRPLTAVLYALLLMSLQEGMLHYPRFIMLIMTLFAVILAHRSDSDAAYTRRCK